MGQKSAIVYILHGHGTQGVLKDKIRDWLQRDRQWVKKWRPADAAEGGDAFTMVEVKKLQM
jgi:DNA-nicking Smr family endonuclease